MEEKVISIIIPVYNSEKSIVRCIESIQRQTYPSLEILIINDGSTDKSVEICEKYAKEDSRICIISQKNKGVSAARNTGITKAIGTYIQFIDSDDYISESCCERLIDTITSKNTDMVICGCIEHRGIDTKAIYFKDKAYQPKQEMKHDFGEIYRSNLLNIPWNKLFIREKIKEGFHETLSLGEDLMFNLAYLRECNSVALISDRLYHYMIEEVSLSKKFRTDYMEISLRLHQEVNQFCRENFGEEYDKKSIDNYFALTFFRGAGILVDDTIITKEEKKKKIKNWLCNQQIIDIMKEAQNHSKQERIVRRIVLTQNSVLFYWMLSGRKLLKKIIK